MNTSYLTSGDLGDALYCLPSIRALGGGILYFTSRPWTRTRWTEGLLFVIKPLIDATGFCTAQLHQGEETEYDFSTFRHGGYKLGDTIVERQRRWVGAMEADTETPWLKADENSLSRIVINRASRWHGFHFPWKRIVEEFYDEITFIGLQSEHEAFQREFGKVFFVPCSNLLEAAEIIAGAELFIGNQSACNAIANGLGKNLVLEVCAFAPDCFLKKPNSFFSFNGEVKFEVDGRKFLSEGFQGTYGTMVGNRELSSDNMEKLRVIARSAHAYDGTFAFYDDVQLITNTLN